MKLFSSILPQESQDYAGNVVGKEPRGWGQLSGH